VTWAHEAEAELGDGMAARLRNAATPAELPAAVRAIAG
jgi:hypothetical protein